MGVWSSSADLPNINFRHFCVKFGSSALNYVDVRGWKNLAFGCLPFGWGAVYPPESPPIYVSQYCIWSLYFK